MVHLRSFTFFLFISICTCHYLHIITYNKLIYIFVLIYIKFILVLISRKSYRTYTYTKVLIHILVILSILYLFRSPIGVTELMLIQRCLYTYLYFYLSYTCSTELILVLWSLYMYRGTRRYYRTYTYIEVSVGTFKAEQCTLLYSYSYSVPYHISLYA